MVRSTIYGQNIVDPKFRLYRRLLNHMHMGLWCHACDARMHNQCLLLDCHVWCRHHHQKLILFQIIVARGTNISSNAVCMSSDASVECLQLLTCLQRHCRSRSFSARDLGCRQLARCICDHTCAALGCSWCPIT